MAGSSSSTSEIQSNSTSREEEEKGLITVLSIDGGGIRGIIPAVILDRLQEQLQALEERNNVTSEEVPKVKIADFFDVIAGTSTGGLLAAVIANRDNPPTLPTQTPQTTTTKLVHFFTQHGPNIFRKCCIKNIPLVKNLVCYPKYDGKVLRQTIRDLFGQTELKQVEKLVIPTFDVKRMQPIIFSSFEATPSNTRKNALLSDVCIGTSAAPTFFPAHSFNGRTDSSNTGGEITTFNLIDGGVAVNNPTLMAITAKVNDEMNSNQNYMQSGNQKKFLVLSLGTGVARDKPKYSAVETAKWSDLSWIHHNGSAPIIDCFSQGSADMVDIHICTLFKALRIPDDHYLRIQAVNLEGDESSVDIATSSNLNRLVKIGEELLDKPMSRVNLETGLYEPVGGEVSVTNEQALNDFAQKLVNERNRRRWMKISN